MHIWEGWKFNILSLLQKATEDLARESTENHIAENEEKLQEFLDFHNTNGDTLVNLAKETLAKVEALEAKDAEIAKLKEEAENLVVKDAEVDKLKDTLYLLTRQIQSMQFNEEEKTRSDGNSGIKQIRTRYSKCLWIAYTGTKPFIISF